MWALGVKGPFCHNPSHPTWRRPGPLLCQASWHFSGNGEGPLFVCVCSRVDNFAHTSVRLCGVKSHFFIYCIINLAFPPTPI